MNEVFRVLETDVAQTRLRAFLTNKCTLIRDYDKKTPKLYLHADLPGEALACLIQRVTCLVENAGHIAGSAAFSSLWRSSYNSSARITKQAHSTRPSATSELMIASWEKKQQTYYLYGISNSVCGAPRLAYTWHTLIGHNWMHKSVWNKNELHVGKHNSLVQEEQASRSSHDV